MSFYSQSVCWELVFRASEWVGAFCKICAELFPASPGEQLQEITVSTFFSIQPTGLNTIITIVPDRIEKNVFVDPMDDCSIIWLILLIYVLYARCCSSCSSCCCCCPSGASVDVDDVPPSPAASEEASLLVRCGQHSGGPLVEQSPRRTRIHRLNKKRLKVAKKNNNKIKRAGVRIKHGVKNSALKFQNWAGHRRNAIFS